MMTLTRGIWRYCTQLAFPVERDNQATSHMPIIKGPLKTLLLHHWWVGFKKSLMVLLGFK